MTDRIPQHSAACAAQDDDAACICGVSEAYTLGLRDGAAGPEPESPASAWLDGYRQGRIEAEAAADVQQYWTDTGHMPAASPAPEVCPVCKLGWDRHLA